MTLRDELTRIRTAARAHDLALLRDLLRVAAPALRRSVEPRLVRFYYPNDSDEGKEVEYADPPAVCLFNHRDLWEGRYTGDALYYEPVAGVWYRHVASGYKKPGGEARYESDVQIVDEHVVLDNYSLSLILDKLKLILYDDLDM